MTKKETFKALVAQREKVVGHKINYTRRDFLAHGLYSFAATLALPSLSTLLAKSAFAADCGGSAAALPFMCFDMAGGAALAGNFLVGKEGGPDDWLKSYSTLGWDPLKDKIDRRFGLPMAAEKSGLFQGLIATMSPEAQAGLRLASVCHQSPLDTSSGRQNLVAYVNALGGGVMFRDGLGSENSASGGNSDSAMVGALSRPTYFSNIDSLAMGMRFGGQPLASLTAEQIAATASATSLLTASQIEQIQSGPAARILRERVECYLRDNSSVSSDLIDPRKNSVAREIFGIDLNSSASDAVVIQAALGSLVIDGKSTASVWTLGECDYHDGSSETGDAKDREMGETIGRTVEYAYRVGKPFFFQIISDGSCSSEPGTRNWQADTNEGMHIFGYFKPNGAPEYIRENMQLGHFTDAQGVERSTLVGADPTRAALAVLANYCHVQGRLDRFKEFTRVFNDHELQSLLVFAQG